VKPPTKGETGFHEDNFVFLDLVICTIPKRPKNINNVPVNPAIQNWVRKPRNGSRRTLRWVKKIDKGKKWGECKKWNRNKTEKKTFRQH